MDCHSRMRGGIEAEGIGTGWNLYSITIGWILQVHIHQIRELSTQSAGRLLRFTICDQINRQSDELGASSDAP